MKYCGSCTEVKSESMFGNRKASKDGLAAKCKSCQSIYDKKRYNLPHRVKARADYAKTDKGILSGNKAKKLYRDRNPNKYHAHTIVGNAIRDKKLFREPCEVCHMLKHVHAHHDDYAKPLNVRWLCSYHHNEWHVENGEALNP